MVRVRRDLASLHDKAVKFHRNGNLEKAEKFYIKFLKAAPDDADALGMLGVLYAQQGKTAKALDLLERACALAPGDFGAHYNLGKLLNEMGRLEEAEARYCECLKLVPTSAEALCNLGATRARLGRYRQAADDLRQAIRLAPRSTDALINLGILLSLLHNYGEAEPLFERASALLPGDPEPLLHLGFCRYWTGKLDAAIQAYERVLALRPDHQAARSRLLMAKLCLCDWRGLGALEEALLHAIRDPDPHGSSSPRPYAALLTSSDPAEIAATVGAHASEVARKAGAPLLARAGRRRDKVHVAYVSADYRDHATSYLVADLIETHDRSGFQVTGISYGPDDRHSMRARMEQAFDRFVDLSAEAPRTIAETIRDLEVDIAVDLQGFNQFNRMEIFAYRPAPVQVLYLGWPATSGATFYDYLLADRIVAPKASLQHFSEAVVWLPHCYQANDRKRKVADTVPSRADCGLPESAFVFCCFNNSFKIRPGVFSVWMRILAQTPGSVLWLLESNSGLAQNLRREAAERGIAPERLVFAKPLPNDEHLARHAHADLFLDTLPYNAHTTASDALWQGVPIVTCCGRTFPGRVASSLLDNVGLGHLVTSSLEEYEALAVRLAHQPDELASLKRALRDGRATARLFDTERLARSIERAYLEMLARLDRGEAPSFFDVAALETV